MKIQFCQNGRIKPEEKRKNTNFYRWRWVELHEFAEMTNIIFAEESYRLIGICFEVHKELGMGFNEIVYKDALEFELIKNKISYKREETFNIIYKGAILPHSYKADFIVHNCILLEVKATSAIVNNFVSQTINYLKASGLQLGIIVNFGQPSLISKRVVF